MKDGNHNTPSLHADKRPSAQRLAEWSNQFKFQTHNDPQLEDALTLAARFCRAYTLGNGPYMLSFIGASGTGKTHLAKQIWRFMMYGVNENRWNECGYSPKIIHWPTFMGELKDSQLYGNLHDLHNWPLLVIDEAFGDKDPSGFSTSELVALLTRREFKHTVLTSNLNIEEIAAIETRIASRMARGGNVFLQMTTVDYSMRKF